MCHERGRNSLPPLLCLLQCLYVFGEIQISLDISLAPFCISFEDEIPSDTELCCQNSPRETHHENPEGQNCCPNAQIGSESIGIPYYQINHGNADTSKIHRTTAPKQQVLQGAGCSSRVIQPIKLPCDGTRRDVGGPSPWHSWHIQGLGSGWFEQVENRIKGEPQITLHGLLDGPWWL